LGTDCEQQRDEKHILLKDCDRVKESLSKGEHVKIVFTNVSKKASPYFVDTTIYPISDVDGRIVEHLHLMHDITELKTIHQEIESTQKEIVYKMGEIGESRSRETGNHVKRVAEYSKLLALLSGLSREDAEILFTASPMHDIGKVAIPDNILNKPGKLTIEEFEVMKNHAQIGYEVLKGSNRTVLKAAAIVAHEHHEKWDGSGYPRGLKGDDIHIFGRITAVADVFDALGHDRVYKKAWELERIYKLFQDERGKHFDPSLIDLVLNNKEKFEQIKDRYND
jgi:response regulator RpfG family c-di-GMP phosphodiesterase